MRAFVFGFIFYSVGFQVVLAQDVPRDLHDCFALNPVQKIECTSKIIKQRQLRDVLLAIVHNNRGNAFYKQRKFDRAITDYSTAIMLNPKYANAYNNRGIVHSKNGHFARAIADFDKAVARNPNYANAFNNRGYAYQKLNRLGDAGRDYRKALDINPSHGNAKANLKRLKSMSIPI